MRREAGEWIEVRPSCPEWADAEDWEEDRAEPGWSPSSLDLEAGAEVALGRGIETWDELLFEDGTQMLVGDVNRLLGHCDCCKEYLLDQGGLVAVRSWEEV